MAHTHSKQWIVWTTTSVVAIALVVVCSLRWQAWFGNPPEPAYVAGDSICRVQLTFGRTGAQSRAVAWQCGDTIRPATLHLINKQISDTQYITANSRLFVTAGGRTACYFAECNNLPAGDYIYRVQVGQHTSQWYPFTMNDADDAVTFVYMGDVQDADGGKLHTCLADINQQFAPDFWLFGGDVIERPHDGYWQAYYDMVADFGTSTPLLAVPGNHEYIKGINKRLDERFVWAFPYFLDADTRFAGVAQYTFSVGNAAFYLLDSNNDVWTLPSARAWLQRTMTADTARWHIATLHHPVYSLRGRLTNFWVRQAFASLFNDKCDLVLAGHEHAYARRTTDGTTPVYIVSQCSPKDYCINFDAGYERYGVGCRFYQIIHITGDTLELTTYTLDHEPYDHLTLIKTGDSTVVYDAFADAPEYLQVDSTRYRKSAAKRAAYQQRIIQHVVTTRPLKGE
ncbi:MAG: metallophosphoesterase family protein [Paludibacteraceae bacterium]